MELKLLIGIFRTYRKTFFWTVIVFVTVGVLWQIFQPKVFDADLTLNVTRKGTQMTSDYAYDDFYRLQADERFADTVVRWLGSARMISNIAAEAKVSDDIAFKAERLSSQMIRVRYRVSQSDLAQPLSQALLRVVNKETEALDRQQREDTWFVVIGDDPVIQDGRTSWTLALGVALALGIFFGMWTVLWKYYLSEEMPQ